MQTLAILPALGIGDALLMMIASHQLHKKGYRVTTFHDALPELQGWFPGHDLKKKFDAQLDSFDRILVENDNSPRMKWLIETYRTKLSIFYPTYSSKKHAPLTTQDRVFDDNLPMAENIARATASLFDLPFSKDNGLISPVTVVRNQKQVIVHPTSREEFKNWRAEGFLKVAKALKLDGFSPLFCVGPHERAAWRWIEAEGFSLVDCTTLADLAALIYASGFVIGNDSLMGHLASNLGIPTVIIANDEKRMRLWRPGWHPGALVVPPTYLPNWKFFRQRWQQFISPGKVLCSFKQLARAF